MSRIAEQVRKLLSVPPTTSDDGQDMVRSRVTKAQVNALLAGKGRVEHLQQLADEYGVELRLERKAKRRESPDGEKKA